MNSERKVVTITTNYVQPGSSAERLLTDAGLTVNFSSEVLRRTTGEAIYEYVSESDALILGTEPMTGEDLSRIQGLQIVARTGSGYDNVELVVADELGIAVCNTPGANRRAVVELTLGLMLSLARDLPRNIRGTSRAEWSQDSGTELSGAVLGIVGLGSIGRLVAKCAQGLGMKVIAYDLLVDAESMAADAVQSVTFDELLAQADFVTLHVALTDSTRNLIDANALKKMKSTAFLVNTARGGIVNEADLIEALNSGEIAGAALDVIESEPVQIDNPILTAPRLILTAHIGGATVQARQRAAELAATQIINFFAGQTPAHQVNREAVK